MSGVVRRSAVAGTWYPGSPRAIVAEVEEYLAAAGRPRVEGRLVGLISPHAGLRYSGPVAAHGYALLRGRPSLTAVLVGVPGSTFSAAGIAFGRDAALVGAGFGLELSPDAKVFVDYDGKLGSRLQEHSVSGGLRVRF